MPSPDLQTWLDQVKRELENAVLSPPEWAVDRMTHRLAEAIASPAMLPPPAHDSGLERFATPFLCGSFIRYSMPVSPGAFLPTPLRVCQKEFSTPYSVPIFSPHFFRGSHSTAFFPSVPSMPRSPASSYSKATTHLPVVPATKCLSQNGI